MVSSDWLRRRTGVRSFFHSEGVKLSITNLSTGTTFCCGGVLSVLLSDVIPVPAIMYQVATLFDVLGRVEEEYSYTGILIVHMEPRN